MRSSADGVARYIRQLIFEGILVSGDRVPQDDIAQTLSLSRIPIREALIALERDGWVDIVLNRGAYVTAWTPGAVLDHYKLLGFAHGLVAQRAVEGDHSALDERLSAISVGLRYIEDIDRFNRADLAFHTAIIDASHSPRIRSMLRATSAIVPGNFFAQVPGAATVEKKATTAIRKAIAAGDGSTAAEVYQDKTRRHGQMVVSLLRARGFFDKSSAPA